MNIRRLTDRQGSQGTVRRLHYQSTPLSPRLNCCSQLVSGGHSPLLAVTPVYPAGKCPLGTEVVEVLAEAYAK